MLKYMNSTNVIIYCRVSTDEQAEQGYSLDYQEESLRKYCELRNYNVVAEYREDHSAKNFKRPEWTNLHAFVKSNKKTIDKVLFTKWDRFSRNIHEAFNVISVFDSMGIELNAVEQWLETENPDRIILLSFYLSIGEAERKKIASRTKDGTYQAKKDGYYASRPPFGYDSHRDGSQSMRGNSKGKRALLVPNQNASLVVRAFKEVAMDMEPIETIRKKLYNDGLKLQKSAFSIMLKNIVYAGKVIVPEHKKELATVSEGKHEPLIDLATFYKVQDVFKGKRCHGITPTPRNLEFPMRDFLTCEICGRQITGSLSSGRSKKYAYYHCREKCKTRMPSEEAHIKISSLLTNLKINQNVKELFSAVLKDSEAKINGNKKTQLQSKIERRQLLKESLDKADDLRLSNQLTPERYNSIIVRYNTELMTVNMDIEVLKSNNESIGQYVESGLELLANMDVLFLESDYDGKRILAGSLFTKKLIFGNDGCRTTDINEVLDVLTRDSKGSQTSKNNNGDTFSSISVKVPGAGVEPARFPTGV